MRIKILLLALLTAFSAKAQESDSVKLNTNVLKTLFFEGVRDKFRENYVSAAANFNKVAEMDPRNDAVLFELASVYYKQNKLQEAELYLQRAIALNKNNTWYYMLQAELYKRSNQMAGLVNVFNELIRLNPDKEDYYYDRANAWFLAGNTEEALKQYDVLEQKFGRSPAVAEAKQRIMMAGKNAPAGSEIDKMLAENPDDINTYLYLSGVLLEKNKLEEALALLMKARDKAPDNYEVRLAMADIFRAQKNLQQAHAELKVAFESEAMPLDRKVKILVMAIPALNNETVRINTTELAGITASRHSNDPRALAVYGDILYRQGNFNGAKTQYLAALKLSDQLFAVWEQLLSILVNSGDYAAAVKYGDEALSIYPNQAILYYYMAFAQHRIGKNEDANSNIKSALLLDSDSKQLKAMIFALQGELFIDQGKNAAADDAFAKAVAADPDNYLILNNYAYYLALREVNLAKAATLIAKAAAAAPQNHSIADTYALVLFKQGKYTEARQWIDKAIQNNAEPNPVYLEHLGDILFQLGSKEEAVAAWKKAQAAGSADEKLKRKINEQKYIK